ncbi:eEF1A lysine and N-terminal methyltransferase homolog isoform X2 [Lycorma delicatula]|uniref:eEF1A lysine and N-terminal methyltransferase homolog isoform X2 n=1 Tax=Lycorma delicatula TaxID=130591 RepID=UPI003F51467C
MNVLPKSNVEFTKKDYWDSFFVKRGKEAFEWYGEYNELSGVLQKYMKLNDTILVVGCGNSNLSIDMFDAGYRDMMNIDISNVAIKQMQRKCKKRTGLVFKQMDVQKLLFEDSKFSVILDKGTLDALMPDSEEKTRKTVDNMFQVFEVVLSADTVQRLTSQEEMIDAISMSQQAALVCSGLAKQNISDSGEVTIDLALPDNSVPRYSIVVTDKKCKKLAEAMTYAAFIVPQGREREWLFGTKEGRDLLRDSSGMDRLAVILLHRGHKYSNLQEVQDEVRDAIRSIAPADILSKKQKIPFLSVGPDLGNRQEVVRGTSDISGEYIVEDAEGDNGTVYRRLIFLDNQNVVQSEARMIKDTTNPTSKIVDILYLSCDHHVFMTAGISMASINSNNSNIRVLIIGLGGGGLCMFIRKYLPQVFITVVDIDPEVKNIAVSYFCLKEDDHLKVIISDGLEYIKNTDEKFDAVLFDVDSKDSSKGLSCPPENFLEPEVIKNTVKCLSDKGVFILNFVCRIEKLRQAVWSLLSENLGDISSVKLKEEVNEIIFCQIKNPGVPIYEAACHFNNALQSQNYESGNIINLEQLTTMVRTS